MANFDLSNVIKHTKMRKILLLAIFMMAVTYGSAFAQKGYEKSVEVGAAIGVGDYSNNAFVACMINGYRINKYVMIGVGAGIGYSNYLNGVMVEKTTTTEYRMDAWLVPIFATAKANFSKSKTSPFGRIDVGYTFDLNQYIKDAPGFMITPSVGIDFGLDGGRSIYAMLGLNLQATEYTYTNNIGTTVSDWEVSKKSELLKAVSLKVGITF